MYINTEEVRMMKRCTTRGEKRRNELKVEERTNNKEHGKASSTRCTDGASYTDMHRTAQ